MPVQRRGGRARATRVRRPSTYSTRITERICARLIDGQSLRRICQDPQMPGRATVFRWLALHRDFARAYAQARDAAVDAMAEEILEIADDGALDWIVKERRDGSTVRVADSEHIQRSRLRVDTRKWLMAQMARRRPGRFGAPDGGPGPGVTVRIVRLSDEDGEHDGDPPAG